jgi:hypothetical protein
MGNPNPMTNQEYLFAFAYLLRRSGGSNITNDRPLLNMSSKRNVNFKHPYPPFIFTNKQKYIPLIIFSLLLTVTTIYFFNNNVLVGLVSLANNSVASNLLAMEKSLQSSLN